MKIAFVVNNFPPRVGGVENHVAELSRELVRQGNEVTVYTLSAEPGAEAWNGVRVIRRREYARVANILGFPGFGTRRWLSGELRRRAIDVVSVHTRFFPMSWVGLRAAHRAGIPVVHTEHGSGHVVSNSPIIALASRFVDYTVGRSVLRQADAVLGVSEAVTQFVRRLSGRSAQVFYNAIAAVPRSEPWVSRPQHLVFVGRIVDGKGWDVFVRAVRAAHTKYPQVTGEMLGDGTDLAAVIRLVSELGLDDVVRVRGRVDAAQVRRAVSGATLVNPTVLAEGFQTTLLEVLAEGGQVVTYPVPGAEALRAEGHPVTVTAERDERELIAAVSGAVRHELPEAPQASIDSWLWPTRAAEFAQLCGSLLRSQTGR